MEDGMIVHMMDLVDDFSLQEVERLTKAMKDPKFMEMFMDYAKEISNPAMKKVCFNLLCTLF